MIKQCFPREEGWGWNLPKMHAFAKMPHYMLRFGSANNFSCQIGECALKGIVKDHAARTQRRPANFAEQCAIREFESNVIKYVMTDCVTSRRREVSEVNVGLKRVKAEVDFDENYECLV